MVRTGDTFICKMVFFEFARVIRVRISRSWLGITREMLLSGKIGGANVSGPSAPLCFGRNEGFGSYETKYPERLIVDDGTSVGAGSNQDFAKRRFDFESEFPAIDFDERRAGLDCHTCRGGSDVLYVDVKPDGRRNVTTY